MVSLMNNPTSSDPRAIPWHRVMKVSTKRLAIVGSCGLPGWGPKDSQHSWLNNLEDMTNNRCQWRTCCGFLINHEIEKKVILTTYSSHIP